MIQRTLTAALLAGALMFTAVGCATNSLGGGGLTPELSSTARSEEQDANLYARVTNNNTRSIWDDFARALLIDRNSRLTPYPAP